LQVLLAIAEIVQPWRRNACTSMSPPVWAWAEGLPWAGCGQRPSASRKSRTSRRPPRCLSARTGSWWSSSSRGLQGCPRGARTSRWRSSTALHVGGACSLDVREEGAVAVVRLDDVPSW